MTKPTTLLGKIRLTISSLTLGSGEKKQTAEEKLAEEAALAVAMSQPSVIPEGVAPSPLLAALPPGVGSVSTGAIRPPVSVVYSAQHAPQPGATIPDANISAPMIPAMDFDFKVCFCC